MTTDARIKGIFQILKKSIEEKLELQNAILTNLKSREKAIKGFLIPEESDKLEKEKLAENIKKVLAVIKGHEKDIAFIDKGLTEPEK